MTIGRVKNSFVDDSRGQTRKAQLAEDREVARASQSKYDSWATRHPATAQGFVDAIKEILSDTGLAFGSVTTRMGSFRSLRQKALRRKAGGSYVYSDPWHDIHDIIGVRVTTYHSMEIPAVMGVLGDSLTVLRTTDKTAETRISGRLGYGPQCLICRVSAAAPSESVPYADMQFGVQPCTVLQHAWVKFKYDIRYKVPKGMTDPRVDRASVLVAGLIEPADQQFDQVVAMLEESTSNNSVQGGGERPSAPARTTADDIVVTERILPGVLAMLLPDVPRPKSKYCGWAEELLEHNGIRTVGQLQEPLNLQCLSAVSKATKYRFNPGHVHAINDLLLAARGKKYTKVTADISHSPKRQPTRSRARLQQLAEAGVSMSDIPEDDRADGDHASQAARHHGRTSASMRESPSEMVTESG